MVLPMRQSSIKFNGKKSSIVVGEFRKSKQNKLCKTSKKELILLSKQRYVNYFMVQIVLMNLSLASQTTIATTNQNNRNVSFQSRISDPEQSTINETSFTSTTSSSSNPLDQTNALQYLQKYGYLNGNSNSAAIEATANNLISEESFTQAIESFQRFAGIPATGAMDELTLKYMQLPRCGNTDKQSDLMSDSTTSQKGIKVTRFGSLLNNFSNDNNQTNLTQLDEMGKQDRRRRRRRRRRRKRYALQGSKWRRQELTYRISQYPSRFAGKRHEVDAQIDKAFGIWSQVAPINFVVKRDGRVHIDIRFASGEHGDGDAFDGPGNTLAHAYFPQYGGDAHFDDQEYWTIDSYSGTNIFQVAAHELGHSLGLGHSNVREALMAPFYQKYKPHFKLHIDDVLAIQALYGEKPLFLQPDLVPSATTTTSTSTTTVTPPPTTTTTTTINPPPIPNKQPRHKPDIFGSNGPELPDIFSGNGIDANGHTNNDYPLGRNVPDLCNDAMIDAATRTEDGSSYVFKGDHYWLLTSEGLARGYPRKIAHDWEGLPSNIDAALTWADGKTFFFKGNKYWRFRNKRRDLGYPKLISSGFAGIPNDIDAAFVWSGNGRTYIFKGSEYWRFDSKAEPPVSSEYPRSIKVWNGVPAHINAAFKWENNVTYFFKGQQYYRFNDKEFKVESRGRPAFPRNSAEWWFGCTGSNLLATQRGSSSSLVLNEGIPHEPQSIPTNNHNNQQSNNDWSFFSGFDAEQHSKIPGTHISDGGPKQTTAAESELFDVNQQEHGFYHRIGLTNSHKQASSSAINQPKCTNILVAAILPIIWLSYLQLIATAVV